MIRNFIGLSLAGALPAIFDGEGNVTESHDGLLNEFEINMNAGLIDTLVEGDIEADDFETKNIQRDLTHRWPDAKIYLEIGYEVDPNVVGVLHQAVKELETKTIVRFKMHDNEPDTIRVITSTGCSSKVGRVGGSQTLKLAPGCARMATIMHEFTHAMGLKHTQSRPDRDDYVTIMWDNISEGHEHNFNKADEYAYTTMGMDYNYMSVMHYSSHGFSVNGEPTIVTHDPQFQDLIGQRASYTAEDIENINLLYTYDENDADIENCKCEKLQVSGLSSKQEKRNGIYTRVSDSIVGHRYSFKQLAEDNFFYYRSSKWWIGSENGGSSRGVEALDVALCAENIKGKWFEYGSDTWWPSEARVKCVDNVEVEVVLTGGVFETTEDDDPTKLTLQPGKGEFFWILENWAETWTAISTTQYIQSPVFTTDEGYSFSLDIYPRGSNVSHPDYISIYATQESNEYDEENIWPLNGKQLTLGIVEQGKPLEERITMRRSTVTTFDWQNPSTNEPKNRGWEKFLSHDLLFYDGSRPNGWDYVYEDTMMFSFRVSEVTGVFLDCEPNGRFDGCMFHQPDDETLKWNQNGQLEERGIARLMSPPMTQWGPRCLVIKLEASTSITLAVSGMVLVNEETEEEFEVPYERHRVFPTGTEQFVFNVQTGLATDFETKVQQRIKIEVINHDGGMVQFVSSEQLYGPCQ